MYASFALVFFAIVVVSYLLRTWKGVHLNRNGFLGLFIVFIIYMARYTGPTEDYFYRIFNLLMLGVGTFLLALGAERKT